MNSLQIVFAGTPEFGLPCLDALGQSRHQLSAVYTQPDRPAGRGQKMQASAVKKWALAHNIPVYQPLNFKSPDAVDGLLALKPDVLIVIAYGLILPKVVLDIPRLACLNVHASLLPRWRGASPIQYAVRHGDKESGVSIMQMDAGMDTGAVLSSRSCPVTSKDTAGSLHHQLAELSVSPLLGTLDALAQGKTHSEPQNHALATYAPKITKEQARIDWAQPASEIERQIRAFNPWPIACTLVGKALLRVHQARLIDLESGQAPGTVLDRNKNGLLIASAHQSLLLEKIQFPGAKVLSVGDWLNASPSILPVGFVVQ